MSKKPPKKSDQKKMQMRRRKAPTKLIAPEYHLIVSEGTKTEPEYFEALAVEINKFDSFPDNSFQRRERVQFNCVGTGRNTIGVLQEAKSNKIEWEKELGHSISHVWVVFDLDDFDVNDFDKVGEECKKLSREFAPVQYHALWSNQSFELWFVLHFIYLDSDLHRSQYIDKLNEQYQKAGIEGEYRKNDTQTFSKLRPYIKNAIRYSKQLRKYHAEKVPPSDLPSKMRPATAVYELFEMLLPYLENENGAL